MNLKRRIKQISSECNLRELDKKGLKYELQPDVNVYGDKILKIIIEEENKNV